jgi:PST family polysaccharide transporter
VGREVADTLKEGKMIFFSMLANSVYVYTSVVILGMFRDTTEIGYYSAACRIIMIALSVIFIPINQAMFPYIGSAFSKSREEGLEMIRKIFPLGIAVSLLYGVFILVFSPLIIHILFGRSFDDAVIILQSMSFIPLVINCGMFLGLQGLVNLKMDKEYFYVILVTGVLSLPLNIVLARYWGGLGTAICWMLTEVLVAVLFFLKLRQRKVNIIAWEYFNVLYLFNAGIRLLRLKPDK